MQLPDMLGPFELGDRIGSGGMSDVYAGTHRQTGVRVALKVTEFTSSSQRKRQAFSAEVASMVRMHHPGIVRVHDWGILGRGAATWFAMEYSDRGALTVASIEDWGSLQRLLRQLLEALAHAHARDVVHRDLKPDNILTFGDPGRVSYRIADFGIAHLRMPGGDTERMGGVSGTPYYMPPEQLRGRWREYGPWTDLYSLACLAFELASGRPPFMGSTPLEIAMQHVTTPWPALVSRFAVPPRFSEWIEGLAARDWRARPRSAAAVLGELEGLSPAVEGTAAAIMGDHALDAATIALPTEPVAGGFERTELMQTLADVSTGAPAELDDTFETAPRPATVAPDWRAETDVASGFVDTGLRLFELRQTRFVGHQGARDAAWTQLVDAAQSRSPRVFIVDDDRRRELDLFASWLVTRARETSGIETVTVSLTSESGAGPGPFLDAIATLVNGHGLSRERLIEHLERYLPGLLMADDELIDTVAQLLDRDRATAPSHEQVMATFFELLLRLAHRAPLVLALSGAGVEQWAWMTTELLLTHDDLPVFVLITTDPESPEPEASESKVRRHPHTETHRLGHLSRADIGEIIDAHLTLEPTLREEAIETALRDTELAIDLIRFGILHGVLEPTPEGYRTAEGSETPRAFDSFDQLVAQRLAILAQTHASSAELLAAMSCWGERFTHRDWQRFGDWLGLEREPDEIDMLLRHRFLEETRGGYRFPSPRLRTALRQLADRNVVERFLSQGGDPDHDLRCARMLADLGEMTRAARRLFPPLFADEPTFARRVPSVMRLVRRLTRALPRDEPMLALGWVFEWRMLGDAPSGWDVSRAERQLADPILEGLEEVELELRYYHASAHISAGAPETARVLHEDLLRDAQKGGHRRIAGLAHSGIGWDLMVRGEEEAARPPFLAATEELSAGGEHLSAAICHTFLGNTAIAAGDEAAFFDHFDRALDILEEHGLHRFIPRLLLERSTDLVNAGSSAAALRDAQAAWRTGVWSKRQMVAPIAANLAICLGLVGRFVEAKDVLGRAQQLVDGDEFRVTQLRLGRAVLAAIEGDGAAWDENIGRRDVAFVPRYFEIARRYLRRHGHDQRAEQARSVFEELHGP